MSRTVPRQRLGAYTQRRRTVSVRVSGCERLASAISVRGQGPGPGALVSVSVTSATSRQPFAVQSTCRSSAARSPALSVGAPRWRPFRRGPWSSPRTTPEPAKRALSAPRVVIWRTAEPGVQTNTDPGTPVSSVVPSGFSPMGVIVSGKSITACATPVRQFLTTTRGDPADEPASSGAAVAYATRSPAKTADSASTGPENGMSCGAGSYVVAP